MFIKRNKYRCYILKDNLGIKNIYIKEIIIFINNYKYFLNKILNSNLDNDT